MNHRRAVFVLLSACASPPDDVPIAPPAPPAPSPPAVAVARTSRWDGVYQLTSWSAADWRCPAFDIGDTITVVNDRVAWPWRLQYSVARDDRAHFAVVGGIDAAIRDDGHVAIAATAFVDQVPPDIRSDTAGVGDKTMASLRATRPAMMFYRDVTGRYAALTLGAGCPAPLADAGAPTTPPPPPAPPRSWDGTYHARGESMGDWRCPAIDVNQAVVVANGRLSLPWQLQYDLRGYEHNLSPGGRSVAAEAPQGTDAVAAVLTVAQVPPEVRFGDHGVAIDERTYENLSAAVPGMMFYTDVGGRHATLALAMSCSVELVSPQ